MSDYSDKDKLQLRGKDDIRTLIGTEGLEKEKVIFSDEIKKLNAKGKKQMRVMMITQTAIYNLKKNKYKQSKRRIRITEIGMITLSASSPEFVIHIPNEYDYHFISKQKDDIAELLQDLFFKATMRKLTVLYSQEKHLKDIVLTKQLAKWETNDSKKTIKKSMKNVLIDMEPENKDNNDDDFNDEQDLEQEPGSPGSPSYNDETDTIDNDDNDNDDNDKQNMAIYQSVVYGNNQLLLQQQNQIVLHNQQNQQNQLQQNQMNYNQQNQMNFNQQNQMNYNQQKQMNYNGQYNQPQSQTYFQSLQ